MIDTHTHLYLPEFAETSPSGPADAVDRAVAAGVTHLVMPNVDLTTVEPMLRLHRERPEVTSVAMGLHPTEIGEAWRDDLDRILALLDEAPDDYVAVGEIGIDLYWDKTFEQQQMQALERQMQEAVRLHKPVIIHCRDGLPQTLEVLQEFPQSRGVMHSFGGDTADIDLTRRIVDYYFGINGIVTFKNSRLRETLPAIGADRLLLETDSPYLAPVPHRGRCNESAYMVHTAAYVAQWLDVPLDELDRVTTRNAAALFGLKPTD